MRLLHAVETLSRGAGGLAVVVAELTSHLASSKDTEVDLLVSHTNKPEPAVPVDDAVTLQKAPADLIRGLRRPPSALPEVVHQHGIWAPLPVAAGRFAKTNKLPLILSPHGMLEDWALRHHAGRKRIAWLLYQHANLRHARVLHAASEPEARQMRALGFRQPIAMIPHGVAPIPGTPLDAAAVAAPKPRRQLLFLSRVHPKKGIDLLLRAWAGIEAPDWELVIAGNDEGGHRRSLEILAQKLGLGDRAHFVGPLYGAEKDTAFRRADLFVLPSHSENFGIVVIEALQYGLPVITTTGTPWQSLETAVSGWWIDPDPASLRSTLTEALQLSERERREMGERGREIVEREHRWRTITPRYLELYRWLANAGPRPDWLRMN